MKKITLKELMKVNPFKAGRVISALNRNRVKTSKQPTPTTVGTINKIKNLLK
jgi:hypothetical protein